MTPQPARGQAARSPAAEPQAALVQALAAELAAITTRPWTLMEVCGGQTHAIVRWGLDQLLPPGLRLVHGPGCPVCVTPAATIGRALDLARRPEVILCSYGDMLRVPGSGGEDLLGVRAAGGDVRLLTSPLQALNLARAHPQRQVVFLAVGFETTAPATALLAAQTRALGLDNLSLLCAHVRVPPAMEAILDDPDNRVQGFLAAGHVCAVQGTVELEQLVARRRLPVVVTGFEPAELLRGILSCVRLLEAGQTGLENAYGRVVRTSGNAAAQARLDQVFSVVDRPWRGFGVIRGGGLALRPAYADLDAEQRFTGWSDAGRLPDRSAGAANREARPCRPAGPGLRGQDEQRAASSTTTTAPVPSPSAAPAAAATVSPTLVASAAQAASACRPAAQPATASPSPRRPEQDDDPAPCIAARILRGLACPADCPAFAATCTPEQPLGAPMVSSEGACAAWYRYRR